MSIRKVLVTGSSGTIGTRLCERLMAETDLEVAGLDRRPNIWSPAVQAVTLVADLLEPGVAARAGEGFDLVVHLAANARVHDVVVDPSQARDNFLTTFNLLEFCRQRGVPRVMFASSREVYGNSDGPLHAEEPVLLRHCESPYAATKMAGEALVQSYHACYGIEFVTFRFSNVYGMYDDSERVVPQFIRRCKAGEDLTVYGADKLLDFTYIDDAVHGVMQAVERFDRVHGEVYNLAYGTGTSILDVARQIRERVGSRNEIHVGAVRTGEVVQYVANLTKARERLRYAPQVPIGEGLQRTVDWYEEHLYP